MSRITPDSEALRHQLDDHGGIEQGIVGWPDGKPHYDLGTEENGGITLVKVKLIRGVQGDGIELLCGISEPLWYIPAAGSIVHVSMPAGLWRVPGNAMIVAIRGKSPTAQFGTGSKQDAVIDFGPDRRAVIRAGQGVVIQDYENRYLAVGPKTGIKAGDPDGSGFVIKDEKIFLYAADGTDAIATLELSENKIFGMCKPSGGGDSSGFKFNGGKCTVMCTEYSNLAGSGVLGGTATPLSGIQYGPGIGVPSTTWKVAT